MTERKVLRDWIDLVDERPRHVPDCPLPRYAFVPGRHPHPHRHRQGQFRDLDWSTAALPSRSWRRHRPYLIGLDWHNRGFHWEAHEVWEACWQAHRGDAAQAHHFLALIQMTIACLHRRRGHDERIVRRLLANAARHRAALRALVGDRFMGLDLAAIAVACEAFADGGSAPEVRITSI